MGELSNTSRTINLIIVLALLIYAFVNLFLVIFAYAKIDENVTVLGDVISNWRTGAVIDIEVQTTCSAGYEPAIPAHYWPGTKAGCWCGGVSSSVRSTNNITCTLCEQSCSTTMTTAGCSAITAKSSVQFAYWDKISTSQKQVCIKRSTETWEKTAPLSSGNCPSGYTTCGSSDSKFCTRESQCPINSVTISQVTTGTSCPAGSCVLLGNDGVNSRIIQYTRYNGVNALPVAEFRLNENGMCNEKADDDLTPGRLQFPLLNSKKTTCNNEGGSRWTSYFTVTEDKLFNYNGIDISTFSTHSSSGMDNYYPTGKTGANYDWKFFNRRMIPWSTTCRDRMPKVIDAETNVKNVRKAQLALLVVGIISGIFLGIILSFMEIQNLRGVDLSCIDGKGEDERKKLKRFKKFVNYGFKLVQFPFQIWAIVASGATKAIFSDVADENCSDSTTNGTMSFIATSLSSSHKTNITAIALLGVSLVLDLLLVAWEKRKASKAAGTTTPMSISHNNNRKDDISISPADHNEKHPLNENNFGNSPTYSTPSNNTNSPNIVIQLQQSPQMAQPQPQPQPQYNQQQYPQQQYPQQQYPQYPPQQETQYPPQGYPQQQEQHVPQNQGQSAFQQRFAQRQNM